MELIKDLIKGFYPLMIAGACVAFVIGIFFSSPLNGKTGVFEGVGSIYIPIVNTTPVQNEGLHFEGNSISGDVPVLKYNHGAASSGEGLVFKDLFQVPKSNGTYVNGSVEDDFAIYLMDIRTMDGNSVLEVLSSAEIEDLEEVPAAFVYDREQDILHIFGSGTYVVYVKIYGSSGGQVVYEFKLPVEAS